MNSERSGSMNGFFFGLLSEDFCSIWGVGFFASDGQNRSWNYAPISVEIALVRRRALSSGLHILAVSEGVGK